MTYILVRFASRSTPVKPVFPGMVASADLQLSYPQPRLALVRLTAPPPGRSASELAAWFAAWNAVLDELESRTDLAGLVVLFAGPTSSGEAQLDELPEAGGDSALGQALGQRIGHLPLATVAGIAGTCHDRLAELAAWCDRRVMAADATTSVGFPSVTRGQIPAWGGLSRVPRQMRIDRAVAWLAVGELANGQAAYESGWVTTTIPAGQLLARCCETALDLATAGSWVGERQRMALAHPVDPRNGPPWIDAAVARLHRTARGHEPVARRIAQTIVRAADQTLADACQLERDLARELAGSPAQRALQHVAALRDHYRRATDATPAGDVGSGDHGVTVIGAGVMGRGIAAAALQAGFRVALLDTNPAALEAARPAVLDEAVALSRAWGDEAVQFRAAAADRLALQTALDDGTQCAVAIESVVENPDVKRQVLAEVQARLPPEAILATNTSSIPIARLSERLPRSDHFCGLHFFNPVRTMPLVEVIRGAQTSPATIDRAVAFTRRIGKLPLLVRDSPGFLVNRMLFAYLNEAIQLLHEGPSVDEVEHAARAFGMPIGPLAMCDLIGIDTVYYAGRTMFGAFPQRSLASPLTPALIKAGRLGRKSGAGFLRYDSADEPGHWDEGGREIVLRYRRSARSLDTDELADRLVLPMLLEALRVLSEGVVSEAADVDLGVICGLGFPAWRGGLLYWADSLGAAEILRRVERFASLGPRWQPVARLVELAETGGRLYPLDPRAT